MLQSQGAVDIQTFYISFSLIKNQQFLHTEMSFTNVTTYTDDAIPVNLIHSTQMQFVLQLERNADCFDHRNSRDVTTQMRGERDVNKSNHCDGSFLNWTKYHSQSELGSVPPLYWVSSPSPAHTNNGYNLLLSPLSSLLFKIS